MFQTFPPSKKKIIDSKSKKENFNIKISKCLLKSLQKCLKHKKYFIGSTICKEDRSIEINECLIKCF